MQLLVKSILPPVLTEKFKNGLAFGEVGHKAGFRNGDKIISVDGKPNQVLIE